MKKDKRNKPGKKKQPKKAERINKKYRTNVDTISLNVEQFTPPYLFDNEFYSPTFERG